MLYVWEEENADLLYDSAPGVQALKAKGRNGRSGRGSIMAGVTRPRWIRIAIFAATCLASPNGMAEYGLANINRMLRPSAVMKLSGR